MQQKRHLCISLNVGNLLVTEVSQDKGTINKICQEVCKSLIKEDIDLIFILMLFIEMVICKVNGKLLKMIMKIFYQSGLLYNLASCTHGNLNFILF